ncbi:MULTISPECIES: transcriptional regulator [unclassified Streptomyces]|uniref:helix-turn-helix transcriptional regulator n=1 Tax=unclassified Streptomyces TaxID=2593676 RepID=UPI0036E64FF4
MTEDPSLPQQQQQHRRRRTVPPRATVDGERLIAVFAGLVEPLGRALPASSEVVLHDLSKLPDSIVAVQGDVTGRRLGDPATDLLLERVADGDLDHQLGYETRLPDGRRMQSSTMIIRDVSGHPVAALCINTDISAWLEVRRIADAMISSPVEEPSVRVPVRSTRTDGPPSAESFPHDVDELAAHLVRAALSDAGIEVDRMKKEHKLRFVETLQSKGFFMLRDAIEMTASALNVSRFTIYNYLNEIDARANAVADPPTTEKASDKHR